MIRLPEALTVAALLAACVPAAPVVRQVEDGVVQQMIVFDTGGNGELVDVVMGPGLVVEGAADATAARRAIHAFCGNTTPFDPDADTDAMFRNPDTGVYEMPGRC